MRQARFEVVDNGIEMRVAMFTHPLSIRLPVLLDVGVDSLLLGTIFTLPATSPAAVVKLANSDNRFTEWAIAMGAAAFSTQAQSLVCEAYSALGAAALLNTSPGALEGRFNVGKRWIDVGSRNGHLAYLALFACRRSWSATL